MFSASFTKFYNVARCLGKGGFGTVFAAVRLSDRKNVAVKLIQKSKIKKWRKVGNFASLQELSYSIAIMHIASSSYCNFRSKVRKFHLKLVFFCLCKTLKESSVFMTVTTTSANTCW